MVRLGRGVFLAAAALAACSPFTALDLTPEAEGGAPVVDASDGAMTGDIVDGAVTPDVEGPDAVATDAGFDAKQVDGTDAGVDAGFDAGVDAGFDAGVDAGFDAGVDAGFDAGVDAGFDAGVDAGFDAGVDAGFDAGVDAGFDAGPAPCAYDELRCPNTGGACIKMSSANCGYCDRVCQASTCMVATSPPGHSTCSVTSYSVPLGQNATVTSTDDDDAYFTDDVMNGSIRKLSAASLTPVSNSLQAQIIAASSGTSPDVIYSQVGSDDLFLLGDTTKHDTFQDAQWAVMGPSNLALLGASTISAAQWDVGSFLTPTGRSYVGAAWDDNGGLFYGVSAGAIEWIDPTFGGPETCDYLQVAPAKALSFVAVTQHDVVFFGEGTQAFYRLALAASGDPCPAAGSTTPIIVAGNVPVADSPRALGGSWNSASVLNRDFVYWVSAFDVLRMSTVTGEIERIYVGTTMLLSTIAVSPTYVFVLDTNGITRIPR